MPKRSSYHQITEKKKERKGEKPGVPETNESSK